MNSIEFIHNGRSVRFFLPDLRDHVQGWIERNRRFYEASMLEDIRGAVSQPGLAVDVGANVGNHTVFFSLICELDVIAIEPSPYCLSILEKNLTINGVRDRVTVIGAAAGERRGRGTLQDFDPTNRGLARVENCPDGELEVVRLDDQSWPQRVSLLKLDVEGSERAILEGAKQLLRVHRPLIYVEAISRTAEEAIDSFLASHGYVRGPRFNATPTFRYDPAVDPAPFDSRKYWQERHERLNGSSRSVGSLQLSEAANRERQARESRMIAGSVRRLLGKSLPVSLLDLGCGVGLHAPALLSEGVTYLGVDISPLAVERARAKVPGGRFKVGDITRYLAEASFDVVLFSHVLIHLVEEHDFRDAIAVAARSLARGGVLLIVDEIAPSTPPSTPAHVVVRSNAEYEAVLTSNGLGFDIEATNSLREALGQEAMRQFFVAKQLKARPRVPAHDSSRETDTGP